MSRSLRGHLRDLMEALRTSPDNVVLISKAAEEVEKSMAKMEVPIREMGAAQQFIEEWRDPSRTPSPVTDLRSHLRGVIRNSGGKRKRAFREQETEDCPRTSARLRREDPR